MYEKEEEEEKLINIFKTFKNVSMKREESSRNTICELSTTSGQVQHNSARKLQFWRFRSEKREKISNTRDESLVFSSAFRCFSRYLVCALIKLLNYWGRRGAEVSKSGTYRQELSNEYLVFTNSISLKKSASIQPRTSGSKFADISYLAPSPRRS